MALDRLFPVDDGIVDDVVDGLADDELELASSRVLLVDSDMPCEGLTMMAVEPTVIEAVMTMSLTM